jgi:ribosomal protein L4
MFAPTKTWRRWHRKININQKRYAMCSAIAATGIPSLVMSKGHRIEEIPEVPLVVSDKVEELKKTKEAVAFLKKFKAWADIEKVGLILVVQYEERLEHLCFSMCSSVFFIPNFFSKQISS